MSFDIKTVLKKFCVIGVSYSDTPISIRELFSIDLNAQKMLMSEAQAMGVTNIIALSTCNRTELYADSIDVASVKSLLVKYSKGSSDLLEKYGYEYDGENALSHLYNVAAGLDSQILGDFQIIGQLKNAYKEAESIGTIDTLFNRMFSYVFQASKKIKNNTELSNGAASVSHVAVQYIKKHVVDLDKANLLLYGTGEIGKITCDNLVRHTNNRSLTLINRSEERAAVLAEKYNITYKPQEKLKEELSKADVVIVATGAHEPTVCVEHIEETTHNRVFLDLSVPRNIVSDIAKISGVSLVGVDELSQINDEVIDTRKHSIPLAERIINESKAEFYEWLEMKHLSPIFKRVKQGLFALKDEELAYHKGKLSDEEFAKVEFIAGNIVNRIAKMGILHIKDVFKTEKGAMDILEKMFSSKGMGNHSPAMKHPHAKHMNIRKG